MLRVRERLGESSRVCVPAPNSALHSGRRDAGYVAPGSASVGISGGCGRRFVFPFLVVLLAFFLSFLVSTLLTVMLARSGLVSHATRLSESLDYVSLIFLLPSHLAHLAIREFMVCHPVSALALLLLALLRVSAFASVLGARSTCRALLASVVPCMSLDDSPLHDARNSRCAGGLSPVCKSTSYNLEVGRQGPTWRRGSKGGVSGPAEDLRSVSEMEAGVNSRPAGGVQGQVAGSLPRRQPGTGTRQVRGGVVTPSLLPEVPGTQFASPGRGLDIRQSMDWTKVWNHTVGDLGAQGSRQSSYAS